VSPAQNPYLELMSVIGHELRRPLTVIRGAATLLLDTEGRMPPDRALEMLRMIDVNVEDMSDLIEDLLVMVHLESHDLGLFMEPIEIAEVVSSALEVERRKLGEHAVTVLGAAPGLVVEADRSRAVRVLRALLSNAARYSPPGSPIEVSVEAKARLVHIEVQDRGPGIPEDAIAHVFDRFYRVDLSRSRHMGGAGLGLSIVSAIIHQHGGQVQVESTPGMGSIFTVLLPLSVSDRPA